MSNIEALYLVTGFWLAALPLNYQLRKQAKQHAKTLLGYEHKARVLVEEAKREGFIEGMSV